MAKKRLPPPEDWDILSPGDIEKYLDPKENAFCHALASDRRRIGWRAAVAAGYKDSESDGHKIPRNQAAKLMSRDAVRAMIRALDRERRKELSLTADRIAAELAEIAARCSDPDDEQFSARNAIQAWAEVARIIGACEPQKSDTTVRVIFDD